MFRKMLTLVLRICGPKVSQSSGELVFDSSTEQDLALAEVEELLTMHKRMVDSSTMKPFKEACPKALYWLGTYRTGKQGRAEG